MKNSMKTSELCVSTFIFFTTQELNKMKVKTFKALQFFITNKNILLIAFTNRVSSSADEVSMSSWNLYYLHELVFV